MRGSLFNLLTRDEATGELLAFNTASGALLAIPAELSAPVKSLLESGSAPDGVPEEIASMFVEQGLLVEDDTNEVEQVLDRLRLGIQDTNRLDVFILAAYADVGAAAAVLGLFALVAKHRQLLGERRNERPRAAGHQDCWLL